MTHRSRLLGIALLILALVSLSSTVSAGDLTESAYGTTFTHEVTAENRACKNSSCTILDHPLTNNNPAAVLFVTQMLMDSTLNPHEVGVQFDGTKWRIVNLDQQTMGVDSGFIVWVSGYAGTIFAHNSLISNTSENFTILKNRFLDRNLGDKRIVIATPNLPAGSTRNKHNIGVRYNGANWTIFNQDEENLKLNSSYNVASFPPSESAFTHVATAENIYQNITFIDNPQLNNSPEALLMVTQTFTVGGTDTGIYNDHPIGVFYDAATGYWTIFNQGNPADVMAEGTAFNIVILETSYATHELLLNGGFEVGKGTTPARATLWNGVISDDAKRVCGQVSADSGNCALQIKGAGGKPRTFTQTIQNPGVGLAHELEFSGYVWTLSMTKDATFTVILKYQGGGSDKLNLTSGTLNAPYHLFSGNIIPTSEVAEILVRIKMPGTGGRIRVDSLHLLRYPLPLSIASGK